jgi:hypothetical protein
MAIVYIDNSASGFFTQYDFGFILNSGLNDLDEGTFASPNIDVFIDLGTFV